MDRPEKSKSQTDNTAIAVQNLDMPGTDFDKWWLLVAGVIGLILFLVITMPDPYLRIILFVRDGIGVTVLVTLTSFFLVIFAGMLGGLGRLSKNKLINGLATLYVEMVRGVPLLVQLLFWYFAFPGVIMGLGETLNFQPFIEYRANAFAMAILGLTFCYGAYMSEIYRAGIQSIGKGQTEAARSLGMTQTQAMRYVILPQAIRVILPPMGNEFISLLKDSSLVSVVAVADMTRRTREFIAASFLPMEGYAMVALLYLVMTLLSARLVTWIEKRTSQGR